MACGSQGIPAGCDDWGKSVSGESSLEGRSVFSSEGKGGLKWVVGYRSGDKIWKRRGRCGFLQSTYLLPWPEGPVDFMAFLLDLGAGINQCAWGRKFGGEDLCDLLEMREAGEESLQHLVSYRVGRELENRLWRNEGEVAINSEPTCCPG